MKDIHPLLDKGKQEQAKRYEKETRLLGLIGTFFSLAVLLIFYYSGFSAFLSLNPLGGGPLILTYVFYIVVFQLILFTLSLPLSFYSGYIHEHKWGFSNHTKKSWILEKIKSFFVEMILMWIVLGGLFWIWDTFPQYWWLAAGLGMVLFSVVFATIFPVVILPIFNKYTRVEDKELTDSLEKILNQGGLRSSGFFKEDMSRQTKKENAFLAGLGKTRRVVLGDNLMDNMKVEEMTTILAHEVGHYKHHHIWKGVGLGTVQQFFVFFIVHLIMLSLFPLFLSSPQSNLTLFPYFIILVSGISGFLFGPLSQALSRYFERQADRYALSISGNREDFVSALAGIANRNLSNAYPQKWVKILFYSHPPIGERLEFAEKSQE
ncbi:M48 family metallopeptidase [Acidobacteriota bacterium]